MTQKNTSETKKDELKVHLSVHKKATNERRVGCLKGKFEIDSDIDWFNDDITNYFFGKDKQSRQ